MTHITSTCLILMLCLASAWARSRVASQIYAGLISDPVAANRKLQLLWIGCGNGDGHFERNKTFSGFLREYNITHAFRETDGAHTWMVWQRYLREISPLLFEPSASPN